MKRIFKNATIITQDTQRRLLMNGMMIIEENKIQYVGEKKHIEESSEVIDLEGDVIVPGFINNHTHFQATTLKGSLEGMNLNDYLFCNEKIREDQDNKVREHYKEVAIEFGMLSAIKAGITTVCTSNCNLFAQRFGVRAYTGPLIMNVSRLHYDYRNFISNHLIVSRDSNVVRPVLFVHSLYRINLNLLPMIKECICYTEGCLFTIHVAETEEEVNFIQKQTGMYPIELLEHYQLLTSNTILVHCTYIKEFEAKLIAKRNTKIVVCPVSNIKLGQEIPNIPFLLSLGIKVCIGTDGIATNNSFDLLLNARLTYFLVMQKYGYQLQVQTLLDMIFNYAAEVLGNEKIGSLSSGKYADFVIMDGRDLNLQPKTNLLANLIFSCNADAIKDVFVDGKQILHNKKFSFDVSHIVNEYNDISCDLKEKLDKARWLNE